MVSKVPPVSGSIVLSTKLLISFVSLLYRFSVSLKMILLLFLFVPFFAALQTQESIYKGVCQKGEKLIANGKLHLYIRDLAQNVAWFHFTKRFDAKIGVFIAILIFTSQGCIQFQDL